MTQKNKPTLKAKVLCTKSGNAKNKFIYRLKYQQHYKVLFWRFKTFVDYEKYFNNWSDVEITISDLSEKNNCLYYVSLQ